MKQSWIMILLVAASSTAIAQSTIYKHVDASGRVTYSNKPIKDAVVVELEPLTTIPATPMGKLQPQPVSGSAPSPVSARPASAANEGTANVSTVASVTGMSADKPKAKPAVAIVTPLTSSMTTLASVDTQTQKRRDEGRRKILEEELQREETDLEKVRKSLAVERQNPELIAAVRMAQAVTEPTPSQQVELRQNVEKASGRIRGLQATAAEHEQNIEALRKELGALKP